MKRWLIFPSIALAAVAIGLVWNFVSLNSPSDLLDQSQLDQQTVASDVAQHQSNSASTDVASSQPKVVATSLQPEVIDRTTEFEQKLSQLEDRLAEVSAELEATRAQQSELVLDSLSQDQLETLIATSSTNVAKRAIHNVAPSVVEVKVTTMGNSSSFFDQFQDNPFFDFFNNDENQRQQQRQGTGSGFFVEYNGEHYILTNHHVIEGATEITVSTPSGTEYSAEVVGDDAMVDLAVLKVVNGNVDDIPVVTFGDSDALEVGDWVAAIGHPYGLQNTVTTGIVSTVGREIPRPDGQGTFLNMIQTDAAINPGNSGGPLVNAKGEVVGINTAIIANAPGLGFTIAINNALRLLDELITTGSYERAWLGVLINDMTPDIADYFGVEAFRGVLVIDVCVGAPAMETLQSEDIILTVEGADVNSISELIDAIQYLEPGDSVQLQVWRAGEVIDVDATLGVRPAESSCQRASQQQSPQQAPTPDSQPAPEAPQTPDSDDETQPSDESGYVGQLYSAFGLTVTPNSEELAEKLDLPTAEGMVIVEIDSQSPVKNTFRVHQVVTQVNDTKIEDMSDWVSAVEASSQSQMISIQAVGNGSFSQIAFPNPDYDGSGSN